MGQTVEVAAVRYSSLTEFSICASPWCLSPRERVSLIYCRTCLVRLYETAPDAVEKLYDARTVGEWELARKLLGRALRLLDDGAPRPLEGYEEVIAENLTRALTVFETFDALLGCEFPLRVTVRARHQHISPTRRHYLLCLANLYDRAQICRGDKRRSIRS